ncbi:hypothetical protein PCASD_19689 [Puccinia coronata f. sp. avenae]|uniref:Uncharacterized protein n=1 Tax=Puccinia coronata f. sp. avenae TaxID=200324 RepID=A0A2N5SX98_9BASI|nr:hypothetical protein PCASD_19689 [Puccinia coronata f. sp. avenae]
MKYFYRAGPGEPVPGTRNPRAGTRLLLAGTPPAHIPTPTQTLAIQINNLFHPPKPPHNHGTNPEEAQKRVQKNGQHQWPHDQFY